ncbi:hypothetical protein KY289_021559 [Solanum tuberosum]|nr:hypothetical protein KY289_021559 [Solanum tuberosum]
MGRRSGGGGGFRSSSSSGGGSWFPWSKSRSSPRLAADKTLKNPPKPKRAAPAPPPAPVQSQPQPAAGGLGSSFTDGMAFGSGNAVGHRVTDAVLGPRVFKHEVQVADSAPSASCAASMTAFQECLNVNGGDLSKCQFYVNMVCECRRSSTTLA